MSFEELEQAYLEQSNGLNWNCLFVLPFWLKTWWQAFGAGNTPAILAVRSDATLLGIAPFMLDGHTAKFLGSESVCDYQDMILTDTCPDLFFTLILDYLKKMNIRRIELGALRPDSTALAGLSKAAEKLGYHLICEPVDRYYQLELPETWEEYLGLLSCRQRHEVRRKIKRLHEAGQIDYHVFNNKGPVDDTFNEFLSLFQASRKDKSEFLTAQMTSFFQSLAKTMAERHMLQLGFLRIDGKAAASTLCFEYANTLFLYNNGYHPEFKHLSAGSLGKIFSIKHAIEKKMACYDFLKGDEAYKKRLGGRPVTLYRLTLALKE